MTSDEGLDKILRGLPRITHTVSGSDGEVPNEMSYLAEWFEDLMEENAPELMKRIAAVSKEQRTKPDAAVTTGIHRQWFRSDCRMLT